MQFTINFRSNTPQTLVQTRSNTLNFRVFPFLHLTLQALCFNACPEQALRVERNALITFFLKSPKNKMSNCSPAETPECLSPGSSSRRVECSGG